MADADQGGRTPEADRIVSEYRRRDRAIDPDTYALWRPVNLFFQQGRARATLDELGRRGVFPLGDRRILDVGCGRGSGLVQLEEWGARRDRLAGIDLLPDRVDEARARLAGADLRVGDASALPWPDAHFDIVCQATVFSSILDDTLQDRVAAEMRRVLRPDGVIVWYDFRYDNPANPHVRGVRKERIARLFPGMSCRLRRVTLAPPLARRLVPLTWTGATLLERLVVLNTHYVAVLWFDRSETNR